jgi:hypothetical protein
LVDEAEDEQGQEGGDGLVLRVELGVSGEVEIIADAGLERAEDVSGEREMTS